MKPLRTPDYNKLQMQFACLRYCMITDYSSYRCCR